MALNFPDSPSVGQIYTDTTSGFSYKWDGYVWNSYTAASQAGNLKEIDDISSSFDGIETTFPITVSSLQQTLVRPEQLILSLGNVIQNPTQDFTLSSDGKNIVFSTPPAGSTSFFATLITATTAVGINTLSANVYNSQLYTVSSEVGIQTTFVFAHGYTAGYLDLYQNGVRLRANTDFRADNGTTFDMTPPATAGDELEAIAFKVDVVGTGGGGATGGGSDKVFYENDTSINVDYTITDGKNAMSAGPITIADGITVTIPDGSTWSVV
jgi:hypothetical protein